MEPQDVTLCGLLYGDYPELATRLLSSWERTPWLDRMEIRLGLNAVSADTQRVVDRFVDSGLLRDATIWRSADNIHKYPMMRRMFSEVPLTTDYVMWFDDDSFVRDEQRENFWVNLRAKMVPGVHMLGAVLSTYLGGRQQQWIKTQPWYRGLPIVRRVNFIVGGWWLLRREVLLSTGWPWPGLDHRGGDVMLGVAMHQNGLTFDRFHELAINADGAGRNHKSPRRGYDSKPIGWHG